MLFWKIKKSGGWLESRSILYLLITGLIIIVLSLYVATFFFMDMDRWKLIWDVRVNVLLIALLTILYTGLYFSTKNYEREKELEYKNEARENVANAALLFAAGQGGRGRNIIITEASKMLFSDIIINNKGKSTENKSVNISIPQNIGKNL